VAAVLQQLAAREVGGDEPVLTEVVEDVGYHLLLCGEVVQAHNDADGQ
jgi:hypothetical protein